jgi:hypothetical protein
VNIGIVKGLHCKTIFTSNLLRALGGRSCDISDAVRSLTKAEDFCSALPSVVASYLELAKLYDLACEDNESMISFATKFAQVEKLVAESAQHDTKGKLKESFCVFSKGRSIASAVTVTWDTRIASLKNQIKELITSAISGDTSIKAAFEKCKVALDDARKFSKWCQDVDGIRAFCSSVEGLIQVAGACAALPLLNGDLKSFSKGPIPASVKSAAEGFVLASKEGGISRAIATVFGQRRQS